MSNVSLKVALAVAALSLAGPAFATNGMRMIGFGPIQNSMGGAAVAAPLDATTVVVNPAGLTALGPRIELAGQAFMPSVEYDATWSFGPPPAPSGAAAQESDRPTDFLPTVAGVYRVEDKVTLGFAALGTAGMGVSFAQGNAGLYGARNYTNFMNMRVAPAAAYRVTDALSVGVAANVQYAMLSWEAGGMAARDRAGALGLGATVGVRYDVAKQLTVGAAYESKSFYQDFEFDVPAHTLFTPGGPVDVPGGTDALDFDQPMVATVGLAARPFDGLLLAFDAQWINWSDTNGADQPQFQNELQNTGGQPWSLGWEDQLVFKLGAQYQPAAVKGLALRAGYNYGANPLDEGRAFESVVFPAIAEHHFTLGAGYDAGHVSVNVAGVYSPESTFRGSNLLQQGIVAYEARMSQLAFELGVAYRF